MKRIFRLILTVFAVLVLILVSQVSALALSKRLWGQTSEGTAAAISQNDWNTSTYVLVTRSDYFTDALAGVSLAYKFFDHSSQVEDAPAPILLTERTRLSPETKIEIQRLQAKIIIILGGPGAITPEVESELRQIQGVGEVQRIWAQNSAGTARDIFERMRIYSDFIGISRPDTAVIATLVNFQDALAASSPAAANNMPILLTEPDSIPAETLAISGTTAILPSPVTTMGSPRLRDKTEKGIEGPHLAKRKRRIKKITTAPAPPACGGKLFFSSIKTCYQY